MMTKMLPVMASLVLALTTTIRAETIEVGSPAPKFGELDWVRGTAANPAKSDGQITVVEFWATWCGPCVESVPHLTEIQHKFAKHNVKVVGVTQMDPGNTLEDVKRFIDARGDDLDYAIAFDKSGDTYRAYMDAAEQMGIPTAFVINRAGKIAWIGHPMDGMDHAIEEMVAGKYDLERAAKIYRIDRKIEASMFTGDFEGIVKYADEALAIKPDSLMHHLWKFRAFAHFMEKPAEAKKAAAAAIKVAGDDVKRLVAVTEEIITNEDEAGVNKLALKALKKVIKSAPKDVDVRVAYFRALAATGDNSKAVKLAGETIELMKGDADKLSRFASVLSSPTMRERCGDLALRAVELAIEVEPQEPAHQMAKFSILHDCKKDRQSANATGHYFVQLAAGDADALNNFAWGLLTEDSFKGQYNELALAASEAMVKSPGGDTWMCLDTLALAKFENGMVDEAIEIEKKAIAKCPEGAAKFELQEALKRFEAGKAEK